MEMKKPPMLSLEPPSTALEPPLAAARDRQKMQGDKRAEIRSRYALKDLEKVTKFTARTIYIEGRGKTKRRFGNMSRH